MVNKPFKFKNTTTTNDKTQGTSDTRNNNSSVFVKHGNMYDWITMIIKIIIQTLALCNNNHFDKERK